MNIEEFNKNLAAAYAINVKLEQQKKMLTECRDMTFQKHTTVKLKHCDLDSISEDEFTILQRSFENVLSMRVDALRKELRKYSISKAEDEEEI
jgi:hypothetical protein